jgi:hypothetical protein
MVNLGLSCPQVLIRRAGIVDRIGALIGSQDIDFGNDKFGRTYCVKCDEPSFARALLHPEMRHYLLLRPEYQWEVRNGWAAAWCEGDWAPEGLTDLLELLQGFHGRIPDQVREQCGKRGVSPVHPSVDRQR